jgi:hypothetical protein
MSDSDFSGRLLAPVMTRQRVHALLQHALLVAHDDVGRAQLDQPLQAVVAVDHAAIQVVQVRGGEASTIERHQRTQLGRDHRHHLEDHPLRPRAGFRERLDQLQALHQLLALGLRGGLLQIAAQLHLLFVEVDLGQDLLDRLGADADLELVLAELVLLGEQLILGQQLVQLEIGGAWFQHHVALEVEDLLQLFQRHIDHQADPAGQRLQEPDMRDR